MKFKFDTAALAAVPLVLATIAALVIYGAVVHGYALTLLWSWFIVPTFGLPPLSVPAAIGLGIVVSFMTKDITTSRDEDWKKPLIYFVLRPWVALLGGLIVRAYL